MLLYLIILFILTLQIYFIRKSLYNFYIGRRNKQIDPLFNYSKIC